MLIPEWSWGSVLLSPKNVISIMRVVYKAVTKAAAAAAAQKNGPPHA